MEGHFDDSELQLLAGAMDMAYEAKVLTNDGYERLNRWLSKNRRQMEDDPVIRNNFGRTLYGFCYDKADGTIGYTFDAQPMTICEKRQQMQLAGVLAAPIFAKNYWFASFSEFSSVRSRYQNELCQKQNQQYFQLLKAIKGLPGVIDYSQFYEAQAQLAKEHSPQSQVAFAYYGWRLNVPKR